MRKRFKLRVEEANFKKQTLREALQKTNQVSKLFAFANMVIKLFDDNTIEPGLLSLQEYRSYLEKSPHILVSTDVGKLYAMGLAIFGHLYTFEIKDTDPTTKLETIEKKWYLRYYLTFPSFNLPIV